MRKSEYYNKVIFMNPYNNGSHEMSVQNEHNDAYYVDCFRLVDMKILHQLKVVDGRVKYKDIDISGTGYSAYGRFESDSRDIYIGTWLEVTLNKLEL